MRYLDYTDQRIRRYIRAKRKRKALLEERKQAIIHRAVMAVTPQLSFANSQSLLYSLRSSGKRRIDSSIPIEPLPFRNLKR